VFHIGRPPTLCTTSEPPAQSRVRAGVTPALAGG
jgi:hypothetical protein